MNQGIEHISYCMDFSNNEVDTYFIDALRSKVGHIIKTETYSEAERSSRSRTQESYFSVFFDGKTDDSEFFINLYGGQTSIFFGDHEIMFIDDTIKHLYTSEDKYGKMVYAPSLLVLRPIQILSMFVQIILLLSKVSCIHVEGIDTVGFDEPKYYIHCEHTDTMDNIGTTLDFGNLHFILTP